MTASVILRAQDGTPSALHVQRWLATPSPEEQHILDRCVAPVLDVGCGPGRHALALAERGAVVLGVDAAPAAAGLARSRGVPVLQRSIFDRLPGEGRWGTALLLDGNIGIGGDPVGLLRRLHALLHLGGRVFAELAPPDTESSVRQMRLESHGHVSAWFAWATVGASDCGRLAADTGFSVVEAWRASDRWFAELEAQ